MRVAIETQRKFYQDDISEIKLDLSSRDEIPKVLIGLQQIYCNEPLKETILKILESLTPEKISTKLGRRGMSYWQILLLGVLRLSCNWDYDKLREIANNHRTVREMLGLSTVWDWEIKFGLQTLRDNISLFTPEILEQINYKVVEYGHKLFGGEGVEILARCDSSVVRTNAHYPTDINLLFDAMRKVIILVDRVCQQAGKTDWRQSNYNIKQLKKRYRKAQRLKHSTSKNEEKKEQRAKIINEAYESYLELAEAFLEKSATTISKIKGTHDIFDTELAEVEKFRIHAIRQVDQVRRRVLEGEKIPHDEKVFSCFEEHTEWITKGKAGVPQELGLRVSFLEDQFGFILCHHVMEKETDDKVTVSFVEKAKEIFPNLIGCSFDKGYYTPQNVKDLEKILEKLTLPKKGKLSKKQQEIEYSEEFVARRKQHSAVESAIHALQNHGLDRCPDRGLASFNRYVALGVLARNLEKLGAKVQSKKRKQQERIEKYNDTYRANLKKSA